MQKANIRTKARVSAVRLVHVSIVIKEVILPMSALTRVRTSPKVRAMPNHPEKAKARVTKDQRKGRKEVSKTKVSRKENEQLSFNDSLNQKSEASQHRLKGLIAHPSPVNL